MADPTPEDYKEFTGKTETTVDVNFTTGDKPQKNTEVLIRQNSF